MEIINVNDINKIINNYDNDNDNGNNQVKIIFRILEMGILFEYLCTVGIVRLLTSSRTLLNFRGIPPDILDRILVESFHSNQSLKLCKLIKLPSSTSLPSTSSLITIAPSLSDVKDRELLIGKMPEVPFTLDDLKSGYQKMKKVHCCVDINTVRIISTNLNDDYNLVNVVEISNSSNPREILVQHHAVQTLNEMVTMYPTACDYCNQFCCENCFECRSCADCSETFCNECETVRKCRLCKKQKCGQCGNFNVCEKCDLPTCEGCAMDDFGTGFCEKCESFLCSKCDFVSYCHKCDMSLCSKCEFVAYCEKCHQVLCSKCGPVQFCADCRTANCMSCEFMMFCHKCITFRCGDCSVRKMWNCFECYDSFCNDCDSNFCFCSKCYTRKCMKCSKKTMTIDMKTYEFKCYSC